jgi:hypothetical protein
MQVKVVSENLIRNYDVADLNIIVHTSGDTGINDSVNAEVVDKNLAADSGVDFSNTAANVYNFPVAYVVYMKIEAGFGNNFLRAEHRANVF